MSYIVKNKTHKYIIEVTNNVLDAYSIERVNVNVYWRKSIAKEMKNVLIAFDILDEFEDVPENLKSLGLHLVFDVNMYSTHKEILMVEGNRL